MYWKMSIDLTRPLVPSMGQHDPLDGLVTYNELQLTATRVFGQPVQPVLVQEIADMTGMTTETTIRILSRLKSGGVIRSSRGKIIIADEAKLKALSAGPPAF